MIVGAHGGGLMEIQACDLEAEEESVFLDT